MGAKGRGKGEFMNPQGIGVTFKGDILVTDSNNQNVQMFSSSGVFISRWGTRGRVPGQLQRPTGLSITKVGTEDDFSYCHHNFYSLGRSNSCLRL